MDKSNQSLVDFLQTLPLSSFMIERNALSNKEAQTLYDLWSTGEVDEYGRLVVGTRVDPMQIASLTTKGYVSNHPNKYIIGRVPTRTLELTKKAKEVIRKIILHKEKSSFDKTSNIINYDAICREADKIKQTNGKIASRVHQKANNWLQRVSNGSNTEIKKATG